MRATVVWLDRGSIPACTGKPAPTRGPGRAAQVYPRMYGETAPAVRPRRLVKGLSPHVRGNPSHRTNADPMLRSIPACTGKPARLPAVLQHDGVYPRMYGETSGGLLNRAQASGLSPHVRGNLADQLMAERNQGSIPACTGKPDKRPDRGSDERVYPRMYGETVMARSYVR